MATKSQRKLEKKRRKERKQLVRRKTRTETAASFAYTGNKYKTEALVTTLCSAETGILQAFVISGRELTDRVVESALVDMIMALRRNTLPPLDDEPDSSYTTHSDKDLVCWCIRGNWRELYCTEPPLGRDKLVGVLRTILGSIEVWKSAGRDSRGYLNYIEGFLGEMGISVDADCCDTNTRAITDNNELLEIGRDWCHDGDQEAALVFENIVEHMIRSGQSEEVVNVCQRLMGEVGNSPEIERLSFYAIEAQRCGQIGSY